MIAEGGRRDKAASVSSQFPNMRHSLAFAAIAAAAVAATSSSALPLSSPPSGFALDGPVTRDSLLAASEFLASSGLREAGFDRVIIGDGWAEAQRDASGQLVAAGGLDIAAVAAELASKGFSLGITANGGERGCRGGPGSLGAFQDTFMLAITGSDMLSALICFAAVAAVPDRGSRRINQTTKPWMPKLLLPGVSPMFSTRLATQQVLMFISGMKVWPRP